MIIHQMLHGYSHGHNFIQGSIVLDSNHDMSKIATLSDWSEYVQGEKSSYLTTYPLDESGYYVIAKTWYATEMKRPGCVWTHSLLIHQEDLKKIVDFKQLFFLFQRPSSHTDYVHPIVYDNKTSEIGRYFGDVSYANCFRQLYAYLLSGEENLELPLLNSELDNQNFILHFFNYIPIGILTTINTCSGTVGLRPYFDRGFSLIFSSAYHKSKIELNSLIEKYPYIEILLNAVAESDSQLNHLLRSYEEDLGKSFQRLKAFLYLLQLLNRHAKTDEEKKSTELEIIKVLSLNYPLQSEGSHLKKSFLSRKVSGFFVLEDTFLYMMCIIDNSAFSKADVNFDERIEALIGLSKSRYYGLLWKLMNEKDANEWGKYVLHDSINHLNSKDFRVLIENNWHLYLGLANMHPQILNDTYWMQTNTSKLKDVMVLLEGGKCIASFRKYDELLNLIYNNCIPVDGILALAISENVSNFAATILDKTCSTGYHCDGLLKLCRNQQKEILSWLKKTSDTKIIFVFDVIIEAISPSCNLVKQTSPKLWSKITYNNIPLSLDSCLFLYALSYNWYRDMDAIALLKKAFMPIYQSVVKNQITISQWRKIDSFMETLKVWQDWDRGKKMRKSVGKRLKDAGCSKTFVESFTQDNTVNKEILKYWKKF